MLALTSFVSTPPRFTSTQAHSLAWLAAAHAGADAARDELSAPARQQAEARYVRLLARVACSPAQIAQRGHSFEDRETLGGTADRMRVYAELVDAYFAAAYADEHEPPDDLLHVTCTGYISPSGAQRVVASRGWPTRVTHAYHMGCYAAIPALRLAAGLAATAAQRIDLVHTELCSLHFDPSDHSLEQLVVQSLFGDGFIRYAAARQARGPALAVLALHERVLPDCADAMSWRVGDAGMHMTLARDVPERIAGAVRGFARELFAKAGVDFERLRGAPCAVHPGGPKIIDRVRDTLELDEPQVATSRAVLRDHGNMSSATLPHIWMRVLADPSVPVGALVPSFAFGPGLTMCGALLEKR